MNEFELYACPKCNNTLPGLEWVDHCNHSGILQCPDCKGEFSRKELFKQWKEENGKEV